MDHFVIDYPEDDEDRPRAAKAYLLWIVVGLPFVLAVAILAFRLLDASAG